VFVFTKLQPIVNNYSLTKIHAVNESSSTTAGDGDGGAQKKGEEMKSTTERAGTPAVGCSESLCENSFFDHPIHLLDSSKFAISKM